MPWLMKGAIISFLFVSNVLSVNAQEEILPAPVVNGYLLPAYVGIGLDISVDGPPAISRIYHDSAAGAAGVLVGDVVLTIDNVWAAGMQADEIRDLMHGPSGTLVNLTLFRRFNKQAITASLLREEVVPNAVRLSWGAVDGAVKYEVLVSNNSGNVRQRDGAILTGDTSVDVLDLARGEEHSFRVRAEDAQENRSEWSNSVVITIPKIHESASSIESDKRTNNVCAVVEAGNVLSQKLDHRTMRKLVAHFGEEPRSAHVIFVTYTPEFNSIEVLYAALTSREKPIVVAEIWNGCSYSGSWFDPDPFISSEFFEAGQKGTAQPGVPPGSGMDSDAPPRLPIPSSEACVDEGRILNVGFYAYFAPVSHSADEDPNSEGFQTHVGYEADLLTALESMNGANLSFVRHPIAIWDDIWLRAGTPQYDIVGGGITILDSRTIDAEGNKVVLFTAGHIKFRQSLLVRAEDEDRLASYDDLTNEVRVGALAGTTGEFRLLELKGIADANGILTKGTRVETPAGTVVADGLPNFIISPSGESANLVGRTRLYPPSDGMPQVVYLGDETGEAALFEALRTGQIDAIARGEIGNREAAYGHGTDFVVTALDDDVEHGGFALSVRDSELASCLNEMLNYLTISQTIGYERWREDPEIFMRRAELWNEELR